jgi:hypothetical protein
MLVRNRLYHHNSVFPVQHKKDLISEAQNHFWIPFIRMLHLEMYVWIHRERPGVYFCSGRSVGANMIVEAERSSRRDAISIMIWIFFSYSLDNGNRQN